MNISFLGEYNIITDQCQSRAANVLIQPSNAWALILCIFAFSNLLVLTSTLLYFRTMFLWLQRQNQQIKTLYKASAIVLTCVNIIALISDVYIVVSDNMHLTDSDPDSALLLLLPVKIPLILLILILETPVACFNTRTLDEPNTRCQRIVHAFALCQISYMVCVPTCQ